MYIFFNAGAQLMLFNLLDMRESVCVLLKYNDILAFFTLWLCYICLFSRSHTHNMTKSTKAARLQFINLCLSHEWRPPPALTSNNIFERSVCCVCDMCIRIGPLMRSRSHAIAHIFLLHTSNEANNMSLLLSHSSSNVHSIH